MINEIYCILNKNDKLVKLDQATQGLIIRKNSCHNLLTNKIEESSMLGVQKIAQELEDWDLVAESESKKVIHLFYDYGLLTEASELGLLNEDSILAIILDFSNENEFSPKLDQKFYKDGRSSFAVNAPSYFDYESAYNAGFKHLLRGDCYQINLTLESHFCHMFKNDQEFCDQFFSQASALGRFASFTYLGENQLSYFSNSPECLFDLDHKESLLHSYPIKGTLKIEQHDEEGAWQKLCASKKDESELFMITDLLRNDLNRVDKACAKVVTKKEKLVVPGLVHSYSHLQVKLEKNIGLDQIIRALFPGGSITGAPKKSVMEVIRKIENRARGFYCGTTLFRTHSNTLASINIRSGHIDLKDGTGIYSSGGGVTVKSSARSEYQELMDKIESFSSLFLP